MNDLSILPNNEPLLDINGLVYERKDRFPTKNSVRHAYKYLDLPYYQFSKNGKIYFKKSEVDNWIKKHSINLKWLI